MRPDTSRKLFGFVKRNEIFIQLASHQIAKAGIPVLILCSFEEASECAEQMKFRGDGHYSRTTRVRTAPACGISQLASCSRLRAIATYLGSISTLMLFRPVLNAAMAVVPVPAKGSRIVSPANENILIRRSANVVGYGAG